MDARLGQAFDANVPLMSGLHKPVRISHLYRRPLPA
ncbi:hypothetical protein CFBP8129_03480 [Xanthomonas hortorum pv. gardneri]|uniref:Uncharacterized protein n=1 Tax=Xanthomonas hortorum pv. gardneri TaxID=2754056 RepID=A0A6V7BIN5_9XANT|nr:hypothetical protein CFBP8129_03480 [Xanthomonas hortorum pv. gardneri]CAD0302130.1 hypothetical protein CFBP8129_03480 [Xanthomonas hortorum pv. gardneri]CAH2706508.1 hypothetical protein NCPPB1935_01790 [Xanthomonas campestris pv. nigromaculans]